MDVPSIGDETNRGAHLPADCLRSLAGNLAGLLRMVLQDLTFISSRKAVLYRRVAVSAQIAHLHLEIAE